MKPSQAIASQSRRASGLRLARSGRPPCHEREKRRRVDHAQREQRDRVDRLQA